MSGQQAKLRHIAGVMEDLAIGRSKVFELIESGELRSVKIGRRRLVPVNAIAEYIARLEAEQCPKALA
ncbi:excisionase family DNA-binding protein [Prescottella equi]|uniref:excisionase family DNA-binding protein n=1 Tax=Rhodococcus hoagii TaxID=43767 RepID=UPI000A5DDB9C|nr:excisionase family DNA-binding protein [Prescottella equi]